MKRNLLTLFLLALVVALTIGYSSIRRETARQLAEMQAVIEGQREIVSLLVEGQTGLLSIVNTTDRETRTLLTRVQGVECWVGIGDAAGKPVEQP